MAIIGPSTTGETMAVIPVAEKEQVPLISCSAGSKITDPVKKWVFKTAQNDTLAVGKIYEYLQKQKLSNVAILTVSDGFGSSGREQLKGQAAKYGITIVSDDTYGPKDTDMTAQLTKIRGSQAQAIICWGTNPGPAVIAKNAKQLGVKIPLFMSHGVSSKKFIELAGDAAEGIKLPSGKVIVADLLSGSDPQRKSLMSFVKDYQKHYKAEGDHFGGHAWDAVMLIKSCCRAGCRHARRHPRPAGKDQELPWNRRHVQLFRPGPRRSRQGCFRAGGDQEQRLGHRKIGRRITIKISVGARPASPLHL